MDEDNLSDKDTDVTRSEQQQKAWDANEGRNVSNHSVDGDNQHRGGNETGAHQEGEYDKDGANR